MAAEESRSEMFLKTFASIPHIIISLLQSALPSPSPSPSPPLLPVTNIGADAHPITLNLQKLELGKLAFTLATTATLALVFSQKYPAAEIDYFVVVGFMAACAAVWNGILFEKMYLQLFGISLVFFCFYALVGSFLPLSFSWACWILAAFYLIPFLYLVIKPYLLPIPT